jgi:hypothetical protein
MPELLPTRLSALLHRLTLSLVCALPLCGVPASAGAQGTPAGLRACAAVSDPGRRLACYDREMGRAPAMQAASAPVAAASSAPAPAPANAEQPAPAAAQHTSRWKILSTVSGGDWHVTAQIARLERSPDSMVLHLDNGQVWRQIGRVSGDLSLHEGDSVTIEEHLGSYWLSSRHVSNMKVRQEPQS